MSTSAKKKRTWAGYACPVCRFVFRVPKGHPGEGVICPACRHLLNLPKASPSPRLGRHDPIGIKPVVTQPRSKSVEPPADKKIKARHLGVEDVRAGAALQAMSLQSTPIQASIAESHFEPRRKAPSHSAPEWEKPAEPMARASGGSALWVVVGSVVGLLIVGIGGWMVLNETGESEPSEAGGSALLGDFESSGLIPKAPAPSPEEQASEAEFKNLVDGGQGFLEGAKNVVTAFLNAESLEDLEPLVRHPGVTMPRMKEWYAKQPWKSPGMKEYGVGGRFLVEGEMVWIDVKDGGYHPRRIAVEKTPDGYLVDWESWVAWSSMAWEDIFEKKPTEPVEVRILCSNDNYYNRLFSDDTRWGSVRLVHPDKERVLYGYIDKQAGKQITLLTDLKQAGGQSVTLKIRFPENSVSDNQVYIDEYVQSGWVSPTAGTATDASKAANTSHE